MQRTADSDYKFLLDVRAYMENKVGQLEFPVELLRKTNATRTKIRTLRLLPFRLHASSLPSMA